MWESQKRLNILYRAAESSKRPREEDEGVPTPEANPKFKSGGKQRKRETTIERGMIYHIECSSRRRPFLTLHREELDASLSHHRFFLAVNRQRTRVRFFNETADINMIFRFLNDDTPYNNLILLIDGQVEHPYSVWEEYNQNLDLLYQKIVSRQVSGHPRELSSTRIIDSASLDDTHQLWHAVYVPDVIPDEID